MAAARDHTVVVGKSAQSTFLTMNISRSLRVRHFLKCITVIACLLLIMYNEAPELKADAKKLKLKDLKKLKKYAYLTAGMSSKFYAIPFPLPLPVFIKRQYIYTQIPIVPRYVDHPKSSSTYSTGASISDSYESASTTGSYALESNRAPEYMSYAPTAKDKRPQHHKDQLEGFKMSGSNNRYIKTLAGLLNSGPMKLGVGGQRDIINKLVSGQAKVISPISFFNRLKNPMQVPAEQGQKHEALNDDASYFLNETKPEQPSKSNDRRYRQHHPSSVHTRTALRVAGAPGPHLSSLMPQPQLEGSMATRVSPMSVLNAPIPNDLLSVLDPQADANSPLESHANQVIAVEAPQQLTEMYENTMIARPQQEQLEDALEQLRAQQLHQRQQEAIQDAIAHEQLETRLAGQQALLVRAQQAGTPEQVLAERLHLTTYS